MSQFEDKTVIHKNDREEIYRVIAENTSDGIVVVDNKAVVRFVSSAIVSLTGYTKEQYEGVDAFGVIHPEDRNRVRSSYEYAVENRVPQNVEYRLQHLGGFDVYVEARVRPVIDSAGEVQYVVAIVRDISERKKAEQMLENILGNVNAIVMSTDKNFSHLSYLFGDTERLMGYPKEAVMEKPILLHANMHPDDDIRLKYEVKRQLDAGTRTVTTFRFTMPGQEETRWMKMTVHPFLDQAGNVERFDIICMDVTDKKQSDLALEESEQRYKSLFENNLDGVFSIDLQGNIVNGNTAFERTTGIEVKQLPDRCFMGLLHDEDHISVGKVLYEVIQGREPRDVECRITPPGHGERIAHITLVPIFFFDELRGVHGIVKDITQRKKDERELIQSEERSKFLQQSLNRFSNDLMHVMKVSELENRLIDEIRAVLPVSVVKIEETPIEETAARREHEISVKIGERENPVYLRLASERPLQKMEVEWLDTAVHNVTLLYDNLQLLEDLMARLESVISNKETPRWMLRLLFKLSEKERASLSSDLHDSVLQDLIIWYRKLESLRSSTELPQETQVQWKQIEEGILDAIHQIRITCNELRPPFLVKMGLVESLRSLFEYARMFSNYEIEFKPEQERVALDEEQILGLYRIVQELLNNASKHSRANRVEIALAVEHNRVCFTYSDDGIGMDLSSYENSFQHMGIAGIEKRVLSLEGTMDLRSAPGEGFHVKILIPIKL